ncbi:MAG TPA: DNA repair protein RecO C-terminal domain-containing protein, partial [Ilumatobacteraceae bacterium]|nr:DNA repair protein RecO C-terminal domain-containing protein [Ilumatobacteraceae bacterium]
ALRTIAERGGPLVVPAFYWKLLAAEGVRPELDQCVRCGETGPLVAFDMDQGGVLCRTCRSGTPISEEALDLMRMILGGRLNDALAVPESKVTHEVMSHATRSLEHHIERKLRSVAMFERG